MPRKVRADTLESLLAKWERLSVCPDCSSADMWFDGLTNQGRARCRCPSCDARFNALTGTIFENAMLLLHKEAKIVKVMCHNASLRFIELTCKIIHSMAFLWHKIFLTVSSWQNKVMFSGQVWIDEMYFSDARIEKSTGVKYRRGLSKDKVCVVVAIDSWGKVLAVISENGNYLRKW